MKIAMRMGFVALSVLVTGCANCGDTPPLVDGGSGGGSGGGGGSTACADVAVTFSSPAPDAGVTSPFTVVVQASDKSGAGVPLTEAMLEAGGVSFNGTINGSKATFSSVTAAQGPQALRATVKSSSCTGTIPTVQETVTVAGTCTPALLADGGITFPQDSNADGVLSFSEFGPDAGMQVRVTSSCATTGTKVQIKYNSSVVAGPVDISSGAATLDVAISADGTYTLFVELLNGSAVIATGSAAIRVERTPPICTNTTKLVNGPKDDADTNTAGFQFTTSGTVGSSTTSVTFKVTGQTSKDATPSLGSASAQFTLPPTGNTTYAVDMLCYDQYGNFATSSLSSQVNFVPPTVIITAPTIPDAGAVVVVASPLAVSGTTNAEDGATACAFTVAGATRTQIACTTVAAGGFSINVPFATDGAHTIAVDVTDAAGNTGTISFDVAVTLSGCGLAFIHPSQCNTLITAAQASNGVYNFQTSSKTVCQGQSVTLTRADPLADGGYSTPLGIGTPGVIDATGVASIAASVTSGSYVFGASVPNLGIDAGITSAICAVTVDLDGPVITNPNVPVARVNALINAAQDGQPATPGAQRILQFNARVPVGGQVNVCTTQAVDPVTSVTRTKTAECTGDYLLAAGVSSPSNGFTFPEGTYSIKVVVIAGSVYSTSPALPVFVDVTRPCVLGSSRLVPQDANHDGLLSVAELGGAPPQLDFSLDPACGDVGLGTLDPTAPIIVRQLPTGTTTPTGAFNVPADVSLVGGLFKVNLTQSVVPEQPYQFLVQVTDLALNTNSILVTGDPATFLLTVDTVKPDCTISSPSSGAIFGIAQVNAGSFPVSVTTSKDVGANGVSITLGASTKTATPSAPSYLATSNFPVTGTNNYAVSATCTDLAGNVSTASLAQPVTIDLDPPTCSISAPTQNGSFTTNTLATTVAVTGAEGRLVSCTASGVALTPAMTVASGTASANYNYANGTISLVCGVSDAAGNSCTAPIAPALYQFVVNSSQCALNLTSTFKNINGDWYNASNTSNIVGTSGTATVTAVTADCAGGKAVTLWKGTITPVLVASTTSDITGTASFANVALTEGDSWEVRIDNGTGIVTPRQFRVAFTPPTLGAVSVNSIVEASASTLYFVAPADNINIGNAGYFADADGVASGAQSVFQIASVTGARKFGIDATLDLVLGGSPVAGTPTTLTADLQPIAFAPLTLAQNAAGTLAVRVSDGAGNVTTTSWTATVAVDVLAPAAPTVTPSLTDSRSAAVNLVWAPTYDDGSTVGSLANAGYQVRWTTSSVVGASPTFNAASFTAANPEVDSPWSASPITRSITSLPPLTTYYFFVRAIDEVGNLSAFAQPVSVANLWNEVDVTGPASSNFGQSMAARASIDADAIPDIVVGAPNRSTNQGGVYIINGQAFPSSIITCPSAACQEVLPPDAIGLQFGWDVSTSGNVGNVAAEVANDLLVAQRGSATVIGRAFLYFGGAAPVDTANFVEFRGVVGGERFGGMAQIVKDIDGDGFDEVAIASYAYNGGFGRVYIFGGYKTRADWLAARTATDGSTGVKYIPTSAAKWILEGPTTLLSTSGNVFGLERFGFANLGDITGDGINDFVIPESLDSIGRVYLYSGATVRAASGPIPLSSALQLMQGGTSTNNALNGFGSRVLGGIDVIGVANKTDLLIGRPAAASVYVYADLAATGAGINPTLTLSGPNSFGAHFAAGDLNGDGANDLAVGEGNTSNNKVWILFQHAGTFDTPVGTPATKFWSSQFLGTALGRTCEIANVDTQSGNELIVGDYIAGTIRIWH